MWASLTASTGYTITVGAAATATTAIVGATTYTAGPGASGTSTGAGGTATNGDINIAGGAGCLGSTSDGSTFSRSGRSAAALPPWAGGGSRRPLDPARPYGSRGGNGGINTGLGATGKQGIAIIEWEWDKSWLIQAPSPTIRPTAAACR